MAKALLWTLLTSSVLLAATCVAFLHRGHHSRQEESPREKRLFPLFQIVTFPNDPCVANTRNGTCYTADECAARSGTSSGTCANGFGVCCTFSLTCGQMSNENCTFFTPPATVTTGTCSVTICPCGDNICQLRLDFTQFAITGPSTSTVTIGLALFDQLVPSNGRAVTNDGQCLTDTFSVTNPTGSSPPVICGTNNGEHLYVDASNACNDLVFQLGANGIGASIGTRNWEIKVTQYSCDFNNLAPDGCDQYFFGNNGVGQVQTFNFNNGHLANQDQVICVRRESGQCRICWSATANTDFMLSNGGGTVTTKLGGMVTQKGVNLASECCNFGAPGNLGMGTQGFDCVEIPGAVQSGANVGVPSRICGRSIGLVTVNGQTVGQTVCSTDTPFLIRFVSDMFENAAESMNNNGGFRLGYFQDATNCA